MNESVNQPSILSRKTGRRAVLGAGLALGALAFAPAVGLPGGAARAAGTRRFLSGMPLFVDTAADLPSHPNSFIESWYVNAAFESAGKVVGLEWHQGVTPLGSTTEFLAMNGTDGVWRPSVAAEPTSPTVGASTTECRVSSKFGTFSGDRTRFQLTLTSGRNAVDVVLTPQREELYNGTTGLMRFVGSDSYEYAFPNMRAKGTLTIENEVFAVDAPATWFDRQWGTAEAASPDVLAKKAELVNQSHWTWLGLSFGEGDRSAISFWDVMEPTLRWTALTYLRPDGVQMNVGAEVRYDRIWTSPDTGQRYPSVAHILAPAIDLDIVLTSMLDRPEFVYPAGQGHSGCQALCQVTGRQGAIKIDKRAIFEMIGGIDI
ncbi:MAG: hypothetical protein J0I45_08290 [Bosea sp.]|nr:hypothetical protein [Bosea sp. (in: a-proteobacteria)]